MRFWSTPAVVICQEGDGWGYNYTSRFQSLQSQVLATRAEGGVRVDLPVEWGDYRIEILDPQTKRLYPVDYPKLGGAFFGHLVRVVLANF